MGADDARLQADGLRPRAETVATPAGAELDQHRVADRLPREAGAGGAEGERDAARVAGTHHRGQFRLVVDDHHQLRHQPVEARVGAVGEASQRIDHQLRLGQRAA